jgi:hypothetical protein
MSLDEAAVAGMREAWGETPFLAKNQPGPEAIGRNAARAGDRVRQDPDLLDFYSQKMVDAVVETAMRRGAVAATAPAATDKNAWVLLVPDVHRPSHSRDSWSLMLRVAENMRRRAPGKFLIVFLGDYLDAYCVSSHAKDPNRTRKLEDEIADGNLGLDEVDAVGADESYMVLGNHCHRLARYLADKAPELYNMLSVVDLLRLKGRGWHVTRYQETLRLGKLNITHDLGKSGATAHEDARRAYEGNAIIGHTHRSSVSYRSNMDGIPHLAAMFGWLGDPKQIDYRHYAKASSEWVHGVGLGLMEPGGVVHVHAAPFISGRCAVFGEVVS